MSFHFKILSTSLLFFLGLGASLAAQNCVSSTTGSLLYNGDDFLDRPTNYFTPGDLVEVCFSLDDEFQTPDDEWVHSIQIVSVGPGFNLASLAPSGLPPTACQAGNGNWAFYEVWDRCITCANGAPTRFFNGYAFDSTLGASPGTPGPSICNDPADLDGNPGNNYGDGAGNCGLIFCFELEVTNDQSVSPVDAYAVSVRVNADGVSGSYGAIAANPTGCTSSCGPDSPVCFPEIGEVFPDIINEPCPGKSFDVQAVFADGSINFNGIDVTWEGDAGFFTGQRVDLPEGTYTLSVSRPNCAPQIIEVELELSVPTLEYTGPEDGDLICFGEQVEMSIAVANALVTSIEWTLNDIRVGIENNYVIPAATPSDAGEYIVNVDYGADCDTSFTVNLQVGEEILANITADPGFAVCQSPNGFDPDITFSAVQAIGNPFPPNWTFNWDDGAGSGPSYAITGTAPGDYLLELTVTNPEGCVQVVTPVEYSIFELPTLSVTPDNAIICSDEEVTLTATIIGGEPDYDLEWIVDGNIVSTGPTLVVNADNPATDLFVQVIDNFDCFNFLEPGPVEILPALPAVTFADCNFPNPDEMLFTWNDVGQQFFNVLVTINGVDGTVEEIFDPELLVTGLAPGSTVTVQVVPVANAFPVSCEGESNSVTCINITCPDLTPTIATPPGFFCSDGSDGMITLTSNSPGNGTGSLDWTGPNNSVAGSQFNPAAAGVGVHTLRLVYTEGICTGEATVVMTVVDPPSSDFTIAPDIICVGGMATMTYDGDATGLTFAWNFGAGATPMNATGPGPHQVAFANVGTQTVSLVASNDQCMGPTVPEDLEIVALPVDPMVNCENVGVDQVGFNWSHLSLTGFNVMITDQPAGATVNEMGNTMRVTGLGEGESVTIRVVALNTGPCGNSEPVEQTCTTEICLDLTPTITTPVASFCSDGTAAVVDLMAILPGAGTPTWSGTGVTGSQFDPAAAGAGTHTVTLLYTEGNCTGTASVVLTVVDPPSSDFTIAPDIICVGGLATMTYDGDTTGLTLDWRFGAGATPMNATGPGPHQVAFANVGTQTVSLVASNAQCMGPTMTEDLEIVALPVDPVVNCENINFDQVGFNWSHPSLTDFNVVITDQPAGSTVNQLDNTMLVTGLVEGDFVTISVTALNAGPCGNSAPVEQTCTTRACPSISLAIDPIGPFCEGDDTDVALTAVATDSDGSGTLSWMQQNGTMSSTFNASTAAPGSYSVIAIFEEMDCTFRDTLDIIINPLPVFAFDLADGPICTGTEVLGAAAGAAQVGFIYGFSAPGATITPGTDAASRNFSWATPGRKFVSLTVTSDQGCIGATFTDSIDVVAPLITPAVTCDTVTMESVTFIWPTQTGVDSFGISVDNGSVFFQDSNTLFVGGLLVEQLVNISVEAFGGLPCPNPVAGTGSCTSVACPELFVALPPDTTFCFMDAPLQYLLTTTVLGDNGGGVLMFSGPGVVQIGADYFFDLDVAGVGEHILTVDFQEGMCMRNQNFTYTVTQIPLSDFEVNGMPSDELNNGVPSIEICAGDLFTIEYTGGLTAADSAIFCYSYSPIEPIPIDTLGFENYTCRFLNPGTYRICLEVKLDSCTSTKNFFDVICVSPPPPPMVNCMATDRNTVVFSWTAVPGAVFYTVTLEDGTEIMTPDLEYIATGLAPGEPVTIEVTADAGNGCGDSGSLGPVSCNSEPCEPLEADLSSIPNQICILDGTEFVSLTEITINGEDGVGTYTFFGTGVTQDTFFAATVPFDEAGTTYTITLNYDEAGPCLLDTTFDITVFSRPMAFITDPGTQCLGDTVLIRVSSMNPVSADEVMVDFADGIIVPDGDATDTDYLVIFPSAGTRGITATVISNVSGCPSEPTTLDIEVVAPLPALALMCGVATLETVEITWADIPGATGFTVTTSNGQNETLPAGTTSYEAIGLLPSTDVTFTVTALGDAPCGDGDEQMITCPTMDCPGGVVQVDTPVGSQCLDGTETAILLEASLTSGDPFNGAVVWMGTGVVDNGDGTSSFDPTGLTAGDYTLTADYDGPANCNSEASVILTLFDAPVIGFNAMPTQLCQGEEFNLFFTGTAEDGDLFDWGDFDGAVVSDLGNESYLLRWDTPGLRTVSLTVNGNCTATADFEITITPTLPAPVVTCARQDLDGVFFTWPVVAEATEGYRVSVNNGPYGDIQVNTDFFVGGLAFGENVTITVISVRSGTNCDESAPSVAEDCAARECPNVMMAPSSPQTFFCGGDAEPVVLNANLSGDDGTGEPVWTGAGIVSNAGVFSFDPVVAGVGSHTLTVTYTQETLCIYSETMTMMVNASPVAAITQGTDVTCAGTSVSFGLNGTPDPDTEYSFNFGGASFNDLGNQNYEITFAAGGTYTVTLTAERNGCISTASTMLSVEEEVSAGTPVDGVVEVCAGTTDPIELTARVVNAAAGGTWSTVSGGVPNGSLNTVTGSLNPVSLAAGNYTFAYTVDGGACPEDAAEVMVNLLAPPVADAGPEQLLTCTMGMVSLDGSNSESGDGYTYLWTNADPAVVITDADQQMIDVGQPGLYQLQVTNAIGCSAVSEVTVSAETEAPVMELEVSNITCFSSDNGAISVTNVNGGRPPYTFSINGEERGQSTLFANLEPGAYDVQITDANGCFSNVILDLSQPDELTVRLQFPGDSATTTAGTEIFITATVNGGNPLDTLIWQPDSVTVGDGQNGIQFVATETQMITVTVVDELGCSATDQMMLLVRRDRPVYFPTAFSPNGDNVNDIFFIGADLDQVDFITDFFIFDRWGEAVYTGAQTRSSGGMGAGTTEGFMPNDPAFGWDGLLNGQTVNPQVLVYTATVHFSDGEVVVYKGDFVLMR